MKKSKSEKQKQKCWTKEMAPEKNDTIVELPNNSTDPESFWENLTQWWILILIGVQHYSLPLRTLLLLTMWVLLGYPFKKLLEVRVKKNWKGSIYNLFGTVSFLNEMNGRGGLWEPLELLSNKQLCTFWDSSFSHRNAETQLVPSWFPPSFASDLSFTSLSLVPLFLCLLIPCPHTKWYLPPR